MVKNFMNRILVVVNKFEGALGLLKLYLNSPSPTIDEYLLELIFTYNFSPSSK